MERVLPAGRAADTNLKRAGGTSGRGTKHGLINCDLPAGRQVTDGWGASSEPPVRRAAHIVTGSGGGDLVLAPPPARRRTVWHKAWSGRPSHLASEREGERCSEGASGGMSTVDCEGSGKAFLARLVGRLVNA